MGVANVVWNWLSMTVEDGTVTQYGMVHVTRRTTGVFYADDGLIGLKYP